MFALVVAVVVGAAGAPDSYAGSLRLYHFVYDWQATIAIGGALVAAYLAARPVWHQLSEMRAQSAIQAYEILRQHSALIEVDLTLANRAELDADIAAGIEAVAKNGTLTPGAIAAVEIEIDKHLLKIERLRQDFVAAGVQKWGTADAQIARAQTGAAITGLPPALLNLKGILLELKYRAANTYQATASPPTDPVIKQLRDSSAAEAIDKIKQCTALFRHYARAEVARIAPLADRAFSSIVAGL